MAILHARQGNWAMSERFATKAAQHGVVGALIEIGELAVEAGQLEFAERMVDRAVKRGARYARHELLPRILAAKGSWLEAERLALDGADPNPAIATLARMRAAQK